MLVFRFEKFKNKFKTGNKNLLFVLKNFTKNQRQKTIICLWSQKIFKKKKKFTIFKSKNIKHKKQEVVLCLEMYKEKKSFSFKEFQKQSLVWKMNYVRGHFALFSLTRGKTD